MDGDDDNDDKMPLQGQIVDLPAIHSQMTYAEIDNFARELVNDISGWRNAPEVNCSFLPSKNFIKKYI